MPTSRNPTASSPRWGLGEAVSAAARGDPVVLTSQVDGREEADVVIPAELVTGERVCFLLRRAGGALCAAIPDERLEALRLRGTTLERDGGRYTACVDARHGTTVGVSTGDRATTVRALLDPDARRTDFSSPGHVLVLGYPPGGVLSEPLAHVAAVELARLAGTRPAAVLCKLIDDRGDIADAARARAFARRHGLALMSVEELVGLERRRQALAVRVERVNMPTPWGAFSCVSYRGREPGETHLALVRGSVEGHSDVPVSIHRRCFLGDVLAATVCDCRERLDSALNSLGEVPQAVIVYVAGDHAGSQAVLEAPLSSHEAHDEETIAIATQVLRDLGVRSIALLGDDDAAARMDAYWHTYEEAL